MQKRASDLVNKQYAEDFCRKYKVKVIDTEINSNQGLLKKELEQCKKFLRDTKQDLELRFGADVLKDPGRLVNIDTSFVVFGPPTGRDKEFAVTAAIRANGELLSAEILLPDSLIKPEEVSRIGESFFAAAFEFS